MKATSLSIRSTGVVLYFFGLTLGFAAAFLPIAGLAGLALAAGLDLFAGAVFLAAAGSVFAGDAVAALGFWVAR